ncbi:MAG: hypothetical protein OEW79_04730 [Betaproteobacteria bacterium]|nr:hypothetical protein [Betaproteobacteria bacterium]MDH5342120.1 hypothetical protein [Betaproteobacteria bacterium]
MELLIHATLTVAGPRETLKACGAHIKTMLTAEVLDGELEEHHGDDALAYDFKVRGGIPFPAFANASQEFPDVVITAEWVNVGAGRKGRARIANGEITEHADEVLELAGSDARNRHVCAAADGTLELAVTLLQTGADSWAGYMLTHQRDALFQITRVGASVDLLATEGDPDWVQRWHLAGINETPAMQVIKPSQRIDKSLYAELEQLAEGFVADWIWFRDAPEEVNAIEIDRFSRYGFTVRDANVRAARLYALRQLVGDDLPLQHSTVDPASAWIIAVIERCWAGM